jgi:hypothetical protein
VNQLIVVITIYKEKLPVVPAAVVPVAVVPAAEI